MPCGLAGLIWTSDSGCLGRSISSLSLQHNKNVATTLLGLVLFGVVVRFLVRSWVELLLFLLLLGGGLSTSICESQFLSALDSFRVLSDIFSVIAAVCAPAYLFVMPGVTPPGAPKTSVLDRVKALDIAGFLTLSSFFACFTVALTFGGGIWAWNTGGTVALFVVGGLFGIVMLIQQYFCLFTTLETRQFPPGHILNDWTLILLNIATAMAATNIYVPLYYIPIYFQFVQGDSAILAAVRLLPYIIFLATMNLASGTLLPKLKY